MKKIYYWKLLSSLLAPVFIAYISFRPSEGNLLHISAGICCLFIIVSAIFLIIKTAKILYAKIKKIPSSKPVFLRPSFAFISAIIGFNNLNAIDEKARVHLWQEATSIQTICASQKKCPTALDGWVEESGVKKFDQNVDGTVFHFFYRATENDFKISIGYWRDDEYLLTGGVTSGVTKTRP
jgi:hypothetical protein